MGRRRVVLTASLDIIANMLQLPGKLVYVCMEDNKVVFHLEGGEFPQTESTSSWPRIDIQYTKIPVKVLLNMDRGELAEANLSGAYALVPSRWQLVK